MIHSSRRLVGTYLFWLTALFAAPSLAQNIDIPSSYFRTSGVSTATGAVFLVIENHGDRDDLLVGASAPAARKAELHGHTETGDGVMEMRKITGGIVVPARGRVELKRGGSHVMLMGLTGDVATAMTIEIILTFEVSGDIVITVPRDQDQ